MIIKNQFLSSNKTEPEAKHYVKIGHQKFCEIVIAKLSRDEAQNQVEYKHIIVKVELSIHLHN